MESKRISRELLLLILKQTSPTIQAKLCLLDTQTRAMAVPILYRHCDLNQPEGVAAFCKAIRGNHSLGPHVLMLTIMCLPPQPQRGERCNPGLNKALNLGFSSGDHARNEIQWTEEHVSDLRSALGLLPKLLALTILAGNSLAGVFDGLEVSFRLVAFGATHFPGAAFMQFLKSQNTIRLLHLRTLGHGMGEIPDSDSDWSWDSGYYDPRNVPIADPLIKAAADPAFLPNLVSLVTEPLKCMALAPGRPITQVTIKQNENAPPLRNVRYVKLIAALGKTSAPLELLTFTSRFTKPKEITSWEFLDLIYETHIPAHLRALVLHDLERSFTSVDSYTSQYPFLLRTPQLLGERFKALERFEVSIWAEHPTCFSNLQPPDYFREFVGTMGGLSVWQEACPTLKKVVLYGEEVIQGPLA
ncbi:hypothetical protein BDV93DRAFT_547305 [Ceratobasidium sp. AG-I]|nr:hypothetical protein BDV93DRAFT_547305 [Ceratobasidium sp. AG-I]